MKIPKYIRGIEQRDSTLEELYRNRNFYHFVYGEKQFNSTVEEVFAKYLGGTMMQTWGNDLIIERVAWEYDNGYLE